MFYYFKFLPRVTIFIIIVLYRLQLNRPSDIFPFILLFRSLFFIIRLYMHDDVVADKENCEYNQMNINFNLTCKQHTPFHYVQKNNIK